MECVGGGRRQGHPHGEEHGRAPHWVPSGAEGGGGVPHLHPEARHQRPPPRGPGECPIKLGSGSNSAAFLPNRCYSNHPTITLEMP
eukprot:1194564-Prorocentrum_minimum.AAC.5